MGRGADEVCAASKEIKTAVLIGVEGGQIIGNDLEVPGDLGRRGAR